MLQGYYFLRPQKIDKSMIDSFSDKFDGIANNYKKARIGTIKQEQAALRFYNKLMGTVIIELNRISKASFDSRLTKFVNLFPALEYLYILDMTGKQVTESICCTGKKFRSGGKIFKAGRRGTDQSIKDYYLYIKAGATEYISRPYMSLASGNLCITVSMLFRDRNKEQFILCADFNP